MELLYSITISIVCFVFTLVITGIIKKYSLKKSLIDIPNDRSSHTSPTPRGGGLSIVLCLFIYFIINFYLGFLVNNEFFALAGGCLLVAIIGWVDDHKDVSIRWRIFGYTAAALWGIYWAGGLADLTIGEYTIELNKFGYLFGIIFVVWTTNLYNFMDGTDAFAAVQTICAGIISGILFTMYKRYDLAMISFVLSSATLGFLYWNYPPAKIFMGDVGSCFIGFCFGILAIIGENSDTLPAVFWVVILSVFFLDATLTLLMRIIKREKWYQAHRSHAYQRLVQMGISHKQLVTGLLGINIIIILPVSMLAYFRSDLVPMLFLFVVISMSFIWSIIHIVFRNKMKTAANI